MIKYGTSLSKCMREIFFTRLFRQKSISATLIVYGTAAHLWEWAAPYNILNHLCTSEPKDPFVTLSSHEALFCFFDDSLFIPLETGCF